MTDAVAAVLHGIRLGGLSPNDAIAARSRLSEPDLGSVLDDIESSGWATLRKGRMPGWMLTKEGRLEGERRLALELDATGRRGELRELYERFLPHNRDFLGLCTDWQLRHVDGEAQGNREPALNDHLDVAYDASIIGRLDALHDHITALVGAMAAVVVRLGAYDRRFTEALHRVHDGQTEWFTKPIIDSYHTVWFELHEDLLATLGIERSSEVAR